MYPFRLREILSLKVGKLCLISRTELNRSLFEQIILCVACPVVWVCTWMVGVSVILYPRQDSDEKEGPETIKVGLEWPYGKASTARHAPLYTVYALI